MVKYLNNIKKNFQFTIETQINDKLNFLHHTVTVINNKFDFSVYKNLIELML